HSDGLLVKAGSAVLTNAVPDSAGVPASYTQNTLVADYNDEQSMEKLFEQYSDQIAAVIVEPVAANMGVVLPGEGFLDFLRRITKENNALLIFDEVITGFRIALGGAAEYFKITPDLITLGKIVGGGMPIGAYGGRRDIMQMVSPLGDVYQAGTLSGNPIATTAGITTLNILKKNPQIYKDLEQKAETIKNAFEEGISSGRVWVNQIGSLLSPFFTDKKVTNYESAVTANVNEYSDYFKFLLENGIYIAPSQFEAMFISNAHSVQDIKTTCELIKTYIRRNEKYAIRSNYSSRK
ncbi:MAG: aminotransferase class III-fold pyridoxal phosphate-dependent enzyme, partial [Herbinix sp.]|nr:aminotransferase class III-fold pyridoxal phosphate-dependent enzyme [Herbinix sp.]